MGFVDFHNPQGKVVPVKTDAVIDEIRPTIPGVDPPNANAVIVFESGHSQAVTETVAEVEDKLK